MGGNDAIYLKDPESLRKYITHLKYARERLLETYAHLKQHSYNIMNDVWRDSVCDRFMEMLEQKQRDLMRITDDFQYMIDYLTKQLEIAERAAHQNLHA
jgi:hypothetical protein